MTPASLGPSRVTNAFLGEVIQICIVTRDHRKTIQGLLNLGIGPWAIRTFDKKSVTDATYRGAPVEMSMKVGLAYTRAMNWEVIEPLTGPSIYRDFLERHGDGVQHLAFGGTGDMTYEARLEEFKKRGYELIQSGTYMQRARFHYFATDGDVGTVFEVMDVPKDFVWPEPEAWLPSAG